MATKKDRSGLDINLTRKNSSQFTPKPLLLSIAESVGKTMGKSFQELSSKETLERLASREKNLESVSLKAVKATNEALTNSLKREMKHDDRQAELTARYRQALIDRRNNIIRPAAQRQKKNEYRVTGKLLHPTTGKPLSGVVVEAIDKDITRHDFLDVVMTDKEGIFEISFAEKDFKERREGQPEIFFRIGGDRENTISVTEAPITLYPGKSEAVNISIDQNLAPRLDKISDSGKSKDKIRLRRANQRLVVDQINHQIADDIGKAFQGSLNQLTNFLEGRISKSSTEKTALPKNKGKISKSSSS